MKQTGILLHFSSLPTEFGIGDLGPAAYEFAKYLASEGHSIWQILPITHCGYGNSPYNPISAFAHNPYLISPELLYRQGLINTSDLEAAKLPTGDTVHYELVYKTKDKLLHSAAANWLMHNDINAYIESNAYQLKPYLAFLALCKVYGDSAWYSWQTEHRFYSETLYNALYQRFKDYMQNMAVCQAILDEQLYQLKAYLNNLGIRLVGDMPLYLSYESAEVWAHPRFFDLDEQGNRLHVAGVPPDAFTAEGQLWGNPCYNWQALQDSGFELFFKRIGSALQYLDVLRLDHFIGYVNYWQVDCIIPAENPGWQSPDCHKPIGRSVSHLPANALNGRWMDAVPQEFFTALCARFGKQSFLAEDLGILNDKVCRIRDDFGFPGMIILQFCFEESVPKVREYPSDRWLYTGTHDNNTLKGWFNTLTPDSPSHKHLLEYCQQNRNRDCHGKINADNIHIVLKNIAMSSGCEKVIFPLQDILGLDENARMNIPGTALGNWQWRLSTKLW